MTFTVLPIGSGGTPQFSSGQERQARSVLMFPSGATRPLGARSGRRVGGGLDVSLVSTTMHIAPGAAVLDVETPVATGAYQVANSADDASLGAYTAPHATLDRIDGVYLQISDNDVDASGAGIFQVAPVYLAGTPASSPAAPATPARAFRLSTIHVPHSGGGAAAVTQDQVFTVAAGGLLPVSTISAAPASPYEGAQIYAEDENKARVWDGAKWAMVDGGEVISIAAAGDHTSGDTPCLVTINAVAGRIYKASAAFAGSQVTAAGIPTVKLLINAAEVYRLATAVSVAASGLVFGSVDWYFQAPATASVPFAITMQDGPGALRIAAGGCQLGVKEVG